MAGRPPVAPQAYCCGCGRFRDKKIFYNNVNEFHIEQNDGKMHYCRDCCKTISRKIMDKYWTPIKNKEDKVAYELGIRAICSFFHIPFDYNIMYDIREEELNSIKSKDWNYILQLTDKAIIEKHKLLPEKWNDLSGNTVLGTQIVKDKYVSLTSEGDLDLFIQLEKTWGILEDLRDYLFLEERFDLYSLGETLTAPMTNMIRYLCRAELDVMKLKNAKADQKDVTSAENRVTDYYKKLKLDDFKFNKAKTEQEKLIEDWAHIHENIEPLIWEDDNLKDRLGIDKDYDDIMRSLGNKIVGTKDYPNITLDDIIEEHKKKGKNK